MPVVDAVDDGLDGRDSGLRATPADVHPQGPARLPSEPILARNGVAIGIVAQVDAAPGADAGALVNTL